MWVQWCAELLATPHYQSRDGNQQWFPSFFTYGEPSLEDEDTTTETPAQKQARLRAAKKAREEAELEIAFAQLLQKNKDNSETWAAIDDSALRKRRISELVKRRENTYRWIYELHRMKKHKEKKNGRIN
jgi:hypothetical protein